MEDGAPLGFAHEMQQPKVHLMHEGGRRRKRATKRFVNCHLQKKLVFMGPFCLPSTHQHARIPYRFTSSTSERRQSTQGFFFSKHVGRSIETGKRARRLESP